MAGSPRLLADMPAADIATLQSLLLTEQVIDNIAALVLAGASDAAVAGLEFTASGGDTARSLAERFGDQITPEDLGCAGNGSTDDTDAWEALVALGRRIYCKPGANYLISRGLSVSSNTQIIGNGCTFSVKAGTGGFNSTDNDDKFNANLQHTCLFDVNGREGVRFENFTVTQSGASERLIQAIGVREGFDTTQLVIRDIRLKGLTGGYGGYISLNSIGDGSYVVENVFADDCEISGTSWAATPQLTVLEVDNDMVSSVPSKHGFISNVRGRNVRLTGSALTTYGQQSDIVTIAGIGTNAKGPTIVGVYGEGVGEVLDLFCRGATVLGVHGKDVTYYVVKLVHGARFNVVQGVTASGVGSAVVTLAGSSASGAGDTEHNIVSGVAADDFDASGASLVLIQENGGTTGLPKNNLVSLALAKGDANLAHIVKDNCADADNGNVVLFADGTAATSHTTGNPDNVSVTAFRKARCALTMPGNQTLANDTVTTVDFSTIAENYGGIADTANDRVVVTQPGLYHVSAACRIIGANDGTEVSGRLLQGSTIRKWAQTSASSGTQAPTIQVSDVVYVDEDDLGTSAAQISLALHQESGVSMTIGAAFARFTVTRVA